MSDQEILTKAVDIALENGWKPELYLPGPIEANQVISYYDCDEFRYFDVIYDKDFAKALWGDTEVAPMPNGTCLYETGDDNINYKVYQPAWQMHLQQMVIAEDPVKYLGESI